MLTRYEKKILKRAIGLVISRGVNPRLVVDWFVSRTVPGDWTSATLLLLFEQARDGADLETMEHFLEINRRGRLSAAGKSLKLYCQ